MNNQFVGDVGDYTKFGMLREFEKAGFSIGINWYKTADDPQKTGGSHTSFLDSDGNQPDPYLSKVLRAIKDEVLPRTIESLMSNRLLARVEYYDNELDFHSDKNRKEKRRSWHEQAFNKLHTQDIIFLDPDNAFETSLIKPHHKKGDLYAGYEEAADYYRAGASVTVYNHLPMRSFKTDFIEKRLRPMTNRLSM